MEERFPLVSMPQIFEHNSTTGSSLNQFNKGFVSLNLWDRQVAALCVRFVLIHVFDIWIVCLFVGASVDVFYEWTHRTSEIFFNARREKSPSSHVMLCLLLMPNHFTWIQLFQKTLSEKTANGRCPTEIARPKGTVVSIFGLQKQRVLPWR